MKRGWSECYSALGVIGLSALLFHLYRWTNSHPVLAWCTAVDYSVIELMKVLFLSWVAFTVIMALWASLPAKEDLWHSRLIGILFGLTLFPVVYMMYTRGQGNESLAVANLSLFLITVALSAIASWYVSRRIDHSWRPSAAWVIYGIFFAIFTTLTYVKPSQLGIFDPDALRDKTLDPGLWYANATVDTW